NKIECMTGVDSDAFKEMVNSYCFIMGTFTVDRLHGVKVGLEVPHPGGVMFYVPHWLWKGREGGLFRQVIQDLSIRDYLGSDLKTYFSREKKFEVLSKYIYHHMDAHKKWAYSFFVCEFLNLGVAVATLFFTNWFLGGEFLTYGADVMEVIGLDPENRTDPMSYVFPRMAKCTFKSFGSSGTIQVRDIYVFLWVWLVMLTTLTSAFLIYRLLTILFPFFRHFLLKTRVNHEMSRDVTVVMKMSSLSDWFLVYSLGKNMEQTVFSEFIHYFAGELSTSTDTLSMDEKEKMKL
ncbi:Innexin inx2-like 1, partial [Homarus americanus]